MIARRRASAWFDSPAAQPGTRCARWVSATDLDRDRAIEDSWACPDSLSIKPGLDRPRALGVSPLPKIPRGMAPYVPRINGTGHSIPPEVCKRKFVMSALMGIGVKGVGTGSRWARKGSRGGRTWRSAGSLSPPRVHRRSTPAPRGPRSGLSDSPVGQERKKLLGYHASNPRRGTSRAKAASRSSWSSVASGRL